MCFAIVVLQVSASRLNAEVIFPPYPPQQWNLTVTFDFSEDVLRKFLDEKPDKDEFFNFGLFMISVSDDFSIEGPSAHPVLTHKISKGRYGAHDLSTLGFVPLSDHSAIYSNSCKALKAFRFADAPTNTDYDAPGIKITAKLEINGTSFSAEYPRLQKQVHLPEDLVPLLSLLRRNLPASYDRLLDYMRVPKLPPLSGDSANQIRKCQLHNEWMKVGDVPKIYGLISAPKSYPQVQKTLFPNAESCSFGGCCSSPDSPKSEKVLYCESCRKAANEWEKNQKDAGK
jgi:hypothetical protein